MPRSHTFTSGLIATAFALCSLATISAPSASAADPVLTLGIDCPISAVTRAVETEYSSFYVGDTIMFVDRRFSTAPCSLRSVYDGTVTGSGPWYYTFTTATSSAYIYFDNATNPGITKWLASFNVLSRPGTGASAGAGSGGVATTYTVRLDPEDGGTCTVASVFGPAGSWQRLPQSDACSKPGFRFVGWEFRQTDGPPTTVYPAYSFLHLTGDNTVFAKWVPVDVPVVEPVKTTRWVIWRWDAKARKMRPVSADLLGLNTVVTIHAPKASAVSSAMVQGAKSLAAANSGTYGGIVTSTDWKRPRIVTAYNR